MKTLIKYIIPFIFLSQAGYGQNVPRPNISAPQGLAVNSYTGNLFYQRNEQSLRGTGFRIYESFYYNAATDTLDYGYGKGWSFYYNVFYKQSKDTVVIQHADAKKDTFLFRNNVYVSPTGVYDVLTKNGTVFTLKSKNGQVQTFGDPSHKKLTGIQDPNGNTITIDYSNGLPADIKNSTGHMLILEWANGHLSVAKDGANTDKKFSYTYNGTGDLLNVVDPMGGKKSFTYDKHFLTSIADENGNPVSISYYGSGGRVKQILTCSTDQRFTYLTDQFETFVIQKGANGSISNGYYFDKAGRLIGLTDPDNNKATFVFDDKNNLIQYSDFDGRINRVTYDNRGNKLTETDPLGFTLTYTYDAIFNNVLSVKNKKGNITSFSYDSKGNLANLTKPGGATEIYTYDSYGRKLSVKNAIGNISTYEYNVDGDLTKIQNPIGAIQYQYDGSCCSVSKIIDANGNATSMTYDLLNHTKSLADSQGNITTYDYDAAGNVVKETNANGGIKEYGYDGLRRLIYVKQNNKTWTFEYDSQSNLIKMTNANGGSTSYTYNNKNQMKSKKDPLGHVLNYDYDLRGNLVKRSYPNGNIINYSYDDMNRLTSKSASGDVDKFSYDENGNMIAAYNNNVAYTFIYDNLDRVITRNIVSWGKSLTYGYDGVNNRISMVDQDGGKFKYEYDSNNRLIKLTNAANITTLFDYDTGGRLIKQTNANGTFSTYHFDSAGRLDLLTNWKNITEKTSFFNYTFDKFGNRITMTDQRGQSNYEYDVSNRLTKVVYPNGDTELFTFDGNGNRISKTKNGTPTIYSYNASDQIQTAGSKTFTFDLNGNTLQQNDTTNKVYTYDGANRLTGVQLKGIQKLQYKYDPFGNKIEKIDTSSTITRMLYDGDNLLGELNSNNLTQKEYTSAGGMDTWLSMTTGNSNYFFNRDGLNSTSELTDINGNVLNQYRYDVSGNVLAETVNIRNSIKFIGRIFDEATNLYDDRTRFFDPSIGRFINEDSNNGIMSDPGSLNKYAYAYDNPTNFIDQTGEKPTVIGFFKDQVIDTFTDYASIEAGFAVGGVVFAGLFVTISVPADIVIIGAVGAAIATAYVTSKLIHAGADAVSGVYDYYNPDPDEASNGPKCLQGALYAAGNAIEAGYLSSTIMSSIPIVGRFKKYQKIGELGGKALKYTGGEILSDGIKDDLAKKEGNPCKPDKPDGSNDPLKSPNSDPVSGNVAIIASSDPNELDGPAGVLDTAKKWVAAKQTLPYKILFENSPDFATAPAQNVTVYMPIDAKLNPSSIRLSDFGFGSFNFTVPPNSTVYSNRLDLRDSLGVFVDVTAGLDATNRRAFWTFQSIDPATGLGSTLPATGGFLPVNDSLSHKGEGYVSLTMIPGASAKTGDTVKAQASIIFDSEQTLTTNPWANMVDAVAPTSKISSSATAGDAVTLNFSGQDDPGGTGIKEYALYVSENQGPFKLYQKGITDSKFIYTTTAGSKYGFYVVATDQVGNTEALKPAAEITSGTGTDQTITFTKPGTVTYGLPDVTLSAVSTSGLPVTFASSDPAIASIVSGKLHVLKAGTITITAAQAGNGTFNPASVNQAVTISKAQLTVTADNKSKVLGQANPPLTIKYAGFAYSDNIFQLDTQPTAATMATDNSPVGNYPITVSGGVSSNYNFSYVSGTLSITGQASSFVFNPIPAQTYGGADFQAVTSSGSGTVTYQTSDATIAQVSASGLIHIVKSGTVLITASDSKTSLSQTLTVNPAVLTITANNLGKTYGSANPALTITYAGFVNGDTQTALTIQPVITTTATTASGAGTYPITANGASAANYTISYIAGTLTVNKAALKITANNLTKVYGSANPVLTLTYTGFKNGDTQAKLTTQATVSTTALDSSPVGSYPVTAKGAAGANYTITYAAGTLTVTPAVLTITANNAGKSYGDVNPILTASYAGFVNGDTQAALVTQSVITTTALTTSPAGTYTITASGAVSPNYTISYVAGTLTVNPAVLTITATNLSKTYGSANPALIITYAGFVNNETQTVLTVQPVVTTTGTTASGAGTYPITANGASAANYTINYVAGTLTVTKAALKITANSLTKVYGSANPVLTLTYTGFKNGDTQAKLTTQATISTTALATSPVGSYPVTAKGAAGANYTITYAAGTLTVTPAVLTITANNAGKSYGDVNPILTASYAGFVNGDTQAALATQPVITTTALTTSPAGTYPVTASGAAAPNYTISYVAGTLTVSPATLTITASNLSKTYGSANPALIITYAGFVNNETQTVLTVQPVVTTTATTASGAGTYPISANGASAANYTINYVAGTLTVNKAALKITANSLTKVYGSTNPVLTLTYTGFKNGDTQAKLTTQATISTTALATSPVGSYPVTAKGAAGANYTITYAAGTLTVTPALLTITANNAGKSYGEVNPILTASYVGFVNGDTRAGLATQPVISTTALTTSPAGTYPITASGAASPNYTVSYLAGTLTIDRAVLIISANDATKVYGAANPSLTVAYSGFVNGDTKAALSTQPAVTTTALTASATGTYPIAVSGAASANYDISYINGTLTITKAALKITATNVTKVYGIANPALTVAYTGFRSGDTPSNLTVQPTLSTTATKTSPAGNYPIAVKGASSPNYTITYIAGTLTIGQANLIITANNAGKSYGDPNPAFFASYSGFVNNDGPTGLTVQPTISTTAITTSAPGNYPVVATGASSPNYAISYVDGNLSVEPAILIISANDVTKAYGTTNPSLSLSYSGFVNGETQTSLTKQPAVSTNAATGSAVGTYLIKVDGAVSTNYDITYIYGTLTVTKAALKVTAGSLSKVYGAVNPILTATYTGFKNGDTQVNLTVPPVISTVAVKSSPAGSYPIIIKGASSSNYSISYVPGVLTVNPASLIITPNNISKKAGEINPAFTLNYAGFVNNDTQAVLTQQPIVTTTATTSSPAGIYPITASGAAALNYIISYTDGALTVNASQFAKSLTNNIADSPGNATILVDTSLILKPIVVQVVSSNGDGINDILTIKHIELYPDNKLVLADKGGARVFEQAGYDNKNHVFDGHSNINGRRLVAGTYFYRLIYRSKNNLIEQTGYFILKY